MLQHLDPLSLHHAYAFIGSRDYADNVLNEWLDQHDLSKEGHAYITKETIPRFSVDDARNVKILQSQSSSIDTPRFFLLFIDDITHEAQNALLKVFEEPTPNTYFFINIPEQKSLIPTLQSRLQIINLHNDQTTSKIDLEEFLSLNTKKRLDIIKAMTDSKKSENERWTKRDAIIFLNNLEKKLYDSGNREQKTFKKIREMRDYLHDTGSSLKMILEYIALNI